MVCSLSALKYLVLGWYTASPVHIDDDCGMSRGATIDTDSLTHLQLTERIHCIIFIELPFQLLSPPYRKATAVRIAAQPSIFSPKSTVQECPEPGQSFIPLSLSKGPFFDHSMSCRMCMFHVAFATFIFAHGRPMLMF